MDLLQQIEEMRAMLNTAITASRDRGIALAESERVYKVKLYQTALQMKDEGLPSTFINTFIYGITDIANLRFERDKAEVMYESAKDYINAVKLQLRILENQLEREWGS